MFKSRSRDASVRPTKTDWKRWFLGRWGERLLLGIVFVLSIASFLHFRAVYVDVLELGSKAPRYIIAQIDFEFLDIEAMHVLKQEKARDVNTIFKISAKEVRQKVADFHKYLTQHRGWRDHSEFLNFEELHLALTEAEDILIKSRFTDGRTIQIAKDLGVETLDYFLIAPRSEPTVEFPPEAWDKITTLLIQQKGIQQDNVLYAIEYLKRLSWNLKPDFTRQNEILQRIEASVPHIYTQIQAGSRFVDAGDTVTMRHIVMMSSMQNALANARNLKDPFKIIGSILLSLFFTGFGVIYFSIKHQELLESTRKMALLASVILITLAFAKFTEFYFFNQSLDLIDIERYPIFVPFASLLISLLLGTRIALFISGFLVVMLSLSLAINTDHFLVINLVGMLVAILSARKMRRRREVFSVCGKVGLSCLSVILTFNLIEGSFWNKATLLDLNSICLFMLFTAVGVMGILPILESLFGLVSNMTLSEYMDPNNELLRRLSLELPGTYQHSLVVGNLAELAALKIGANSLFCRVSALYHDIGKLSNPHYFSENQLGGFNIHQLLTPGESAQVIIAHVREGEMLARKYHLPESIIDIIREHHGTTLVYCFYANQLKQFQDDPSQVNEELFRYAGPTPRTKESAIMMIADSVEAASRSLEDCSEEAIAEMVGRVVDGKVRDRQFDRCQLTFEELVLVKESFVKTLSITHHLRVRYPKEKRPYAVHQ